MTAQPVSRSITSDGGAIGTSQNPTSRYQPRPAARNSSAGRQPALIGPLGYDDLK
jgi:hypothetical protein